MNSSAFFATAATLLTLTASEALACGLAAGVAEDYRELAAKLGPGEWTEVGDSSRKASEARRAEVERADDVILVPQRAVREIQGQYQALVLAADDTVEVRGITLGTRIGSDWIVESGLKAGDRLILAGTQRLRGGMKVVPKPAGAPPAGTPADGAAAP